MPLAEFLDGSEEGVDLNLSEIGQAKGPTTPSAVI
jgi:hypothetical protein